MRWVASVNIKSAWRKSGSELNPQAIPDSELSISHVFTAGAQSAADAVSEPDTVPLIMDCLPSSEELRVMYPNWSTSTSFTLSGKRDVTELRLTMRYLVGRVNKLQGTVHSLRETPRSMTEFGMARKLNLFKRKSTGRTTAKVSMWGSMTNEQMLDVKEAKKAKDKQFISSNEHVDFQ